MDKKLTYVDFKLSDSGITSYVVSGGEDGDIRFNITLWNGKPYTIIAKGVNYIEDKGTSSLSGIALQADLDTATAKGYAIVNEWGDITMKFRATSVAEVKE